MSKTIVRELNDETARLILMEKKGRPSFTDFHARMSEEFRNTPWLVTEYVIEVWHKYMGFTNVPPTHSIETGEPL